MKPRPENSVLLKWLNIIRENPENLQETLSGKGCTKTILWYICHDNNLRNAGTKWQLAGAIVEWVSIHRTVSLDPTLNNLCYKRREIIPEYIVLPTLEEDDETTTATSSTMSDSGSVAMDDDDNNSSVRSNTALRVSWPYDNNIAIYLCSTLHRCKTQVGSARQLN